MIVDTSAILAIVVEEVRHEAVSDRLVEADVAGIGAPTFLEAGIVLTSKLGASGPTLLARFIESNGLSVLPFGEGHCEVALDAFLRYGKGRHPARLNFGDCMTYATAKLAGEPLLCVGDDFPQTDLEIVPI